MKNIFLPFAFLFIGLTAICQNPLLLKDVYPGVTGSGIQQIVKTSNYTFFNAEDDDPDADRGLYRTDGTPGGTIKLNLTYPTYISTKAEKLTALGDKIVFAGDNLPYYGEIWVSDGTQAGTIAIERFQPSVGRATVQDMARLGAIVMYTVVDNNNHTLLRKTDGTIAGTSLVYDFSSFSSPPEAVLFQVVNNILYFIVYDIGGTGIDQLWRTDGTTAGTYMLYDFGLNQYVASNLMPAGNNFYVMLVVPGTGNVLWKSDGTAAGTMAVKLIGTSGNNNYPQNAAIGSTLYFAGLDGNGKELWKTDGTAAGTVMVADINAGAASSNPFFLTAFNNNIYFAAAAAAEGNELWKYDGVSAILVKDINPGTANSAPGSLVVSNNTILFRATTLTDGSELWITDGTTANTLPVANINPGAASSSPNLLTTGNPVYFSANNGINGVELFKYDNTAGIAGLHKIYVNDNNTVGDIFTTAIGNDANAGTRTAPVATINYALSIAQTGDTIVVDAGTYAEQILVNKGITISGAGVGLTKINRPTLNLAAAPGLSRCGVINTVAGIGNFVLKNLAIESAGTATSTNGGFCVVSQTGGEISGCELQGGYLGDGVYFSNTGLNPINIAVLNNNFRNIFFFGVNIQGALISAVVNNNSIDVTGSPYGMGILGGGEPTFLDAFSASGNLIKGFNGFGIKYACNSAGTLINNNYLEQSLTLTAGGGLAPYIQNTGSIQGDASCNWYGTSEAQLIKPKIAGNINYTPWLVSGTDLAPAQNGFQPAAGTCTGRQNKFYVNDNSQAGDVYTTAVGNNANNGFSTAPFATINYAISVAQAGDTIIADAGSYAERIFVNKQLSFKGAYAGTNPGSLLNRGSSETILLPATESNTVEIVTVQVANVSFDGFLFDGDNQAITGSVTLNGIDVNAGMAIFNTQLAADNLTIKNNIFKNFYRYGVFLQKNTGAALTGALITRNRIDNVPRRIGADGRGVAFFSNVYGTISENIITRVSTGVIMANYLVGSTDSVLIASNTIAAYSVGIHSASHSNLTSSITIANNQITVADLVAWNAPGSTPVNTSVGINLTGATNTGNFSLTNNNISGTLRGIGVSNLNGTGQPTLTNNVVTGTQTGMQISGITTAQPVVVDGGSISNSSQIGLFYIGNGTATDKLITSNFSLLNNVVGMDASAVGGTLQLEFTGVTITGGTTGIRFYGTQLSLPGNALSGVSFSGQTKEYILQTSHSFEGQTIDASTVSFDGLLPINMTLAQLFATEDKLTHKIDFDSVGYFKLRPTEVFVTPTSFAADLPPVFGTPTTTPSIKRAIGAAGAGDIINIAAGTYTGQFTIDKALTLKGEGAVQTIISRGSAGALVPLPGMNEMGIIQSTVINGNVVISDLTVDGSNGTSAIGGPHHAIMLQSAGAIRNCEITNMQIQGTGSPEGNGIFVNYIGTDPRTMEIINNNIHGIYWVGINAQGNNLSTTMSNNSIDATGAIYGMGIIGGAWGTTLPLLNIINNDIKGYNGFGMTIGSTNGIVNNNSLVGINAPAINTQGASFNATCNWFGSTDPAVINSKISGPMNHSPWLTNGTDTDPANGFQPLANVCNGRQNKFYVNDNSQSGDVFTTAVGSPSNNGYPSAPLPSIPYAYGRIQAGDTIFVDAGTYDQAGVVYALNKGVTILGTNYNVSPNDASNKLLPNATRNAESILTNGIFIIAANDISIKGFTLDLGDHRAIELQNSTGTNNNFGNFLFEKNIHKINTVGNFNQFPITGKLVSLPSLPVTSGFTFSDNRFEKSGTVGGTTFAFNYVKDVTVTGNAFVVTGTTFKTQAIANLGNTGIVDNYNFQNNAADGAGIVANCIRVSSGVISQNILNNCDRGINVQGSMLQSSSLEFNNNTLTQTTGGTPFLGYNRAGSSNPAHTTIFKVQNNIISGTRVPGLANQFFGAMNFTINNSEKNPLLTISGNQITFSGDFSSVGASEVRPVTVRGNVANLTMESNEIRFINSGTLGAAVGLPSNPAFTINTDFNSGAYMPSNAIINILNNKVQGFKQSVVFYDATNAGRDAFVGYGNIPAGATVNVNNNSFTVDSISINSGAVGEIINASCNWYGFKEAHNVMPKVTETTVNYSPWLTNGTDTDVAIGFQPMADVCNGVPVDADIVTVTNVTCNGAANGAIDAFVEEGLAPFTYAWSKDGVAGYSTSEDLSNLAPGDFKLIVTDANGSVDSVWTTITEPDILTATATGTNNICHGGTIGTADISVTGGTLPYTYLWSNAATTESLTGLAAGIYTVTVTDANGCTAIAGYEVTQPTLLTAVATGTSTSCSNSATVTATGGTGSYTYLWSNSATTQTINSIPAGTYSVIVTDANGCTASASVIVTAGEAFNPSASVANVSCFGGTNGSITVTNVNATAPFSFSIDAINFQAGTLPYTFSNLAAGVYTVSVKDANGCVGFVTKTISQPPLLTVVLNNVQSTCFGLSTGAIAITATGGSGAFSYSWTGPNSFTSVQRNINNLATGNYTLTVTDNNNCTSVLHVVVPSLNVITVNAVVTNVLCRGTLTGAINLTVSGGSGSISGFAYSWTGGIISTAEDIFNLGFGNYNVSITDIGSGCVTTRSYTVTQPASNLALSATKTNATGCNSLGTITATGSGGTSPYQYKLDNDSYQNSGSFTGLYAGSFTTWVRDANGCTKSVVVSITDNGSDAYESNNSKNQAKAITIGTVINARIALATDAADWFKFTTPAGTGNYIMTFTHPTASFTFNMYTSANNAPAMVPVSSTATTKEYVLLGNTTYYVSITGGLSYTCYSLVVAPLAPLTRNINNGNISIEKEKTLVVEITKLAAVAYPNPHKGSFNIRILSPEEGLAKIELFSANGQKLAERNFGVNTGENNIVSFTSISKGTVFYRVQIGKQVAIGKVVGLE